MAHCPNCGTHLRFIDWKPVCPGCGVNLNYFNSNENLLNEAEKSEIEHAKFRPRIDRGKVATIASSYGIVRLVLRALPLGALFLPLATADGSTVNAMAVYKYISSADIGALLNSVMKGELFPISLVCLLLSAVLILVNLFMLFGAMGRKWIVREPVMIGLFTGFAAVSAVLYAVSGETLKIGAFVYIGLGIAQLVWNFIILSKSVTISYTPWLSETDKNYKTGKALPVKYTECLIGGLPAPEYFALVAEGRSTEEIRRIMLPVLAKYQDDANRKRETEEAEKKREEDRKHGIES